MAFCKNCGTELAENQLFCTNCGTAVAAEAAEPFVTAEPAATYVEPEKPKARLNVAQLVLSIVNIYWCCGFIFGIIALVNTIKARGLDIDEAARKTKKAKILNIFGIIVNALFWIVFYIVYIIVIVFLEMDMAGML